MATDPSQMTPEAAQQMVQDMHDQLTPAQLRPMLQQHYENLSPDDLKAAIAALQTQLAQQSKPETQAIVASVDPATATAQTAVDLHAHAHEHHPEVVRNVVIATAGTAAAVGLAALAFRHFSAGKTQGS